jgi:ankyrin repeat protein
MRPPVVLLKAGANPTIKNKEGMTAADIARKAKFEKWLKLIETAPDR